MTIRRINVGQDTYDFGLGLRSNEGESDTIARHHKLLVGGAKFVAVDEDSDVRGVMIQRPDGSWHQLRESEVLDLVPGAKEGPESVMLARLDRTSGVLRLGLSEDACDIESMRSTVRPFSRIEFQTDSLPLIRRFQLHLPRIRQPLMRYVFRSENGASAGSYTLSGHITRYAAAPSGFVQTPAFERGPEDTSLEATSIASAAMTSSATDVVSDFIDGIYDFVELSFSGAAVHTGSLMIGWS